MSSIKKQIIQHADELIRSEGYNAFSYIDISKPLGVKNAAIHYHFPSKLDLARAVVQFHVQSFERFTERVKEKSSLSKIKLFLNFYTSIQHSGRICVIGAFASDWNAMNSDIQDLMNSFTQNIINWLSNTLESGLKSNSFTLSDSPQSEALAILTNIFAATQLSRITGNEHFAAIKQTILKRITN